MAAEMLWRVVVSYLLPKHSRLANSVSGSERFGAARSTALYLRYLVQVGGHAYAPVDAHAYAHVYVHTYAHAYAHAHAHVDAPVHAPAYVHLHMCMHMHMHMHMCKARSSWFESWHHTWVRCTGGRRQTQCHSQGRDRASLAWYRVRPVIG